MIKDILTRYINYMISGDAEKARALFFDKPRLDIPERGKILGEVAFMHFVSQRSEWMSASVMQMEHVATTMTDDRIVEEYILNLKQFDKTYELPIAVVADLIEEKLYRVRVYYSLWSLQQKHQIRKPILKKMDDLAFPLVIQCYQQALRQGDLDTILAQFAKDAIVREPAGGHYIHRGSEQIKQFYQALFSNGGGVVLDYCSVTDDGEHCAIEYNVIQWGRDTLPAQAGVAVYEYKDELLTAVRIYDDVDPPIHL